MSSRSIAVGLAAAALLVSSPAFAGGPTDLYLGVMPRAGLRVAVDASGFLVDDELGTLTLRTEALGRTGSMRAEGVATPRRGDCDFGAPRLRPLACDLAVERPLALGVERWLVMGDAVEHGWTIDAPPPGEGALVIAVEVGGADVALAGNAVRFATATRDWTYAGLRAWDVRGRELPAHFEVAPGQVSIVVDDADATYPVSVDPVLSTASQTLTQNSTDFGIAVASGGDVNKDGKADVLVGARFGQNLFGQAFSFHGTTGGVSTTPARTYNGAVSYGKFGEYVDNAGDLNNDGYDDAIICEFYEERFFVYLGGPNGLGANAATTVSGVYGLGRGLAIVGDMNGDGYDDVLAGSQEPNATFYKGSSSGLDATAVAAVATTEAPSVASAGHTNNDVYDDAIYGDAAVNKAYLVRGASTFAQASFPANTTTLTRAGSVSFGYAVTGRGDINGDGYDDVAVSDPGFNASQGRVVVFYGAAGGISSANAAVLAAPTTAKTGFGASLNMVGDVNGDGYDDLVVADDYDHAMAYLFHGSASGLVATPANTLSNGDANFAYAIGGRGDVDGDGYDDVTIGDIGTAVYLYRGCPDADHDGFCTDLDCDDQANARNPNATETCDGVDNDCDGKTDDADTNVSGQSTWYRDADGDGYGTPGTTTQACVKPAGYVANNTDCSDGSGAVNPGATETCNAIDDDCDGKTDDADTNVSGKTTWYRDADGDGYGTPATSTQACVKPSGYVASNTDCNDGSGAVSPAATESCNSVDDDCDGKTDDADTNVSGQSTWYRDADGDGYGTPATTSQACVKPSGYVASNTDCNDGSGAVSPVATESCNAVDDDCDGKTDDADTNVSGKTTWYRDADGDGYGTPATTTQACVKPTGYVASNTDCNDGSAAVSPVATESCNAVDDDCDGKTDDADTNVSGQSTWYRDADGDGYGTPATTSQACVKPTGYVASNTDCNDGSGAVSPVATESCNAVDDDCDGKTDDADTNVSGQSTWYRDADGDGYGTAATTSQACVKPSGYVASNSDCDDGSGSVSPVATETCNAVDDDCDGKTDDADTSVSGQSTWYEDGDGDGYGAAARDPGVREAVGLRGRRHRLRRRGGRGEPGRERGLQRRRRRLRRQDRRRRSRRERADAELVPRRRRRRLRHASDRHAELRQAGRLRRRRHRLRRRGGRGEPGR
ncbi:MAG: MopE-related protein [Myxococcota bacterium]